MIIVAAIPARYAATRFPGKLMQMLGNKTTIRHVYDNTVSTGLFNDVFVVTDSDIIYKEIKDSGGKVIMSKKEHESGSDRIAEAIAEMNIDELNILSKMIIDEKKDTEIGLEMSPDKKITNQEGEDENKNITEKIDERIET